MNRRHRRRIARLKRIALVAPPMILGALYLLGTRLPPVHTRQRRVTIPQSPETVWRVLTDLDGMPAWRKDLTALERLPSPEGTMRWREVGEHGTIAFERIEARAPERLIFRSADRRDGAGRRWEYRIRGTDGGAEFSVTEERTITNPLLRVLLRVSGGGGGGLESLCRDLEARMIPRRSEITAWR